MKTNRNARTFAKIRLLTTVLWLLTAIGFEVWLGAAATARLGQSSGVPADGPQAPDASLGALFGGAR